MILASESSEKNNKSLKTSDELNKKDESRASSAPPVNSEYLFAYNVKYCEMFKSKKKEETDNEFYENVKQLNDIKKNTPRLSNATINETISIKEENFFNKDMLNLINSPTKSKKRKQSNLSSTYSDENQSSSNRRISTNSVAKLLKVNLQKNVDDNEFKDNIKRNTGSIVGTPSPFEKKDFIHTPNDFLMSSNNNTPVITNRLNVDKSSFEQFTYKEDNHKSNKNSIPNDYSHHIQINDNNIDIDINNNNINPSNNSQTINKTEFSNINDNEQANKLNNVFNVNINPNVNLFNFPIIKATGQLNQINNNFYNEGMNNYSNIFKFPQSPMNNMSDQIKNSLFTINNINNQPQKLIGNNAININNTINININNNIINNTTNITQPQTPHTITIQNSNNFNYNKGGKYIKQNLNYAEMDKEELAKYVDILGKDQAGCRLLQKRISEDPSFSNDYLYHQMIDRMSDFMYDAFGNYLVQKILENISDEKKKEIINIIEPEFLDLGCNPHGTRVIQKIIEVITHNKDLINYFIQVFEKNSINLMKDINGNHIIIKYVFTLVAPLNDFIYKQLVDNIIDICTHKHGCCVLQKCIEGANDRQRKSLIESIIKNTKTFILDQYGNYVVQFIIMMNDQIVNKNLVLEIFKNDINFLSKQRFSSNVIEKCFDNSNKETKDIIIRELAKPDIIASLLFDMYGNYVLQKALSLSSEPHYSFFLKTIAQHLDDLKNYSSFGNKLYIKLINTYPKLNSFKKNCNQSTVSNIVSNSSNTINNYSRPNEQSNYLYKPKQNANNKNPFKKTNFNNNF